MERSISTRWARHLDMGVRYLSLAVALAATERGVAQSGNDAPPPPSARLTVRPHAMATATRTLEAGDFVLDSLPEYWVHVPPQCVGTRRCPLYVFLPGGGSSAEGMMIWQRPVADKYGMVVLTLTLVDGESDSVYEINRSRLDAALKQILRRFAIDPDRIAITGRCASGPFGTELGTQNPDVFSRIGAISGGVTTSGLSRPTKPAEFFLDAGFLESVGIFTFAPELRRLGYTVKLVIGFRGHEHQWEDYDSWGRWLQQSWAMPNPAARPAPRIVADPVPVLTAEALTRMTTFWRQFIEEPESIRIEGRRAHLREVSVALGAERPSVWMTDMPALAAQYPSVAADLQAAGLTAQQHEAYRAALLGASVAKYLNIDLPQDSMFVAYWRRERGELPRFAVKANSSLGRNIAFLQAHPDELQALEATEMWSTP